MAIVVEDGSGKVDAEAYASVAEFKAYCDGRGLSYAGLVDARIEQLLREATDFIGGYAPAWQGSRVIATQALDWPRKNVIAHEFEVAPTVVPRGVKEACCLLAHKAISGPLIRDLKPTKTRVKVGPIETEIDPTSPQQTRYAAAARLLSPYLRNTNPYSVKLERA